jgi:hypothetical protein
MHFLSGILPLQDITILTMFLSSVSLPFLRRLVGGGRATFFAAAAFAGSCLVYFPSIFLPFP